MLKMEEVAKGVYSYRGELENPEGIPLVGVHLWYNQFGKYDLFQINGETKREIFF